MTTKEKEQIASRLRRHIELKGSQKRAANSLEGVSSATVNKIVTGLWDGISDAMWRGVANQLMSDANEAEWAIAETKGCRMMRFVLQEVQEYALTAAVTGPAGCGKTEAIRRYALSTPNVYHIECAEYWRKKKFIGSLLKAVGSPMTGGSLEDMMEEAVREIARAEHPIVVLDEADKLSDAILYFFITLYNMLEGRCGFLLCATGYLEKRLNRGVALQRKGYEEIYSRLGRRVIRLDAPHDEDITAVCLANGITSPASIRRIVRECDCDLRMVRRAVWAERRQSREAGDK